MKQAPILLMTYRRSENTKVILSLLKKFNQKTIYVFNDGLKDKAHKNSHDLTRKVILGFKKKNYSINTIFSKKNLTQKKIYPML